MTVYTATFKLEKHGMNQVRFTMKIAFFSLPLSLPLRSFYLPIYNFGCGIMALDSHVKSLGKTGLRASTNTWPAKAKPGISQLAV